MQNVDIWHWGPHVSSYALLFLFISILILCGLCTLLALLCRKSSELDNDKSSSLPPSSHCSYRRNFAFDMSETSPSKVEERRRQREARLSCSDISAEVALDGVDRSLGKALAVEKMLQDSYIFDTQVMGRPSGNVHVLAAKRDYI